MRVLALIILLCFPSTAFADWQGPKQGQVRLVKLSDEATPYGLEFRLQFGWHTYWGLPGDAGLPPRVTLNGVDVPMHFPKPDVISEEGVITFGYIDHVVLPLTVDADAEGKLRLDYGICADICIPVRAELVLGDAPRAAMPLIPAQVNTPLRVKAEDTRLVLLNNMTGFVLLGVGADYAVQGTVDDRDWAVFDLGSAAEVERALTQPLFLYRYDGHVAERYAVQPSNDGSN